jgi:ABC-2 type transport system permease protein
VSMLGVSLSILFKDSVRATQILMLIAAPAFIIGGYSWPLQAMPQGVQLLAGAIPLTPFLEAHKMMLYQKATLTDILPNLKILLFQLLAYGGLAYMLLRYTIYKSKSKV